MARTLDRLELERYGRHLTLPEVGPDGQARLTESSVLCVGAGGLGSPLALYLAAAGIGRLGLVDFDSVDLGNLQRQVLYGTRDVGRLKLDAACERLADVNPHVALEPHPARLTASNALEILSRYDVVADGTDNFASRYLVNDACVLLAKPNVYGSIYRFEGQASVFWRGRGPCYRCLFPEPPAPGAVPSCAEGGVLGVLPGIVGAIQATEVVKILLGRGRTLAGRLLLLDALDMSFRELRVRRDPRCPLCGDSPSIREPEDLEEDLCGAAQDPGSEPSEDSIEPAELRARLSRGEQLVVVDVRTDPERQVFPRIDGSLHIPMDEIPNRHSELDRRREIVVFCRSGARSGRVAGYLREMGFRRVRNLRGGTDAWDREPSSRG